MTTKARIKYSLIGIALLAVATAYYFFAGKVYDYIFDNVIVTALTWCIGGGIVYCFCISFYMIFASQEGCDAISEKLKSAKIKGMATCDRVERKIKATLYAAAFVILWYLLKRYGDIVVPKLSDVLQTLIFWIGLATIVLCGIACIAYACISQKKYEEYCGKEKE